MKAGYQTSEFWVTVLGVVLMVLVAFGVLQQDEADQWKDLVVPVIGAIVPLVVYVLGRVNLKKASGF